MDRMVKADGEAGKAQADVNKAHKALRQLEIDVDALRLVFTHSIALFYIRHQCT